MEKSPEVRYQTAGEVGQALNGWLDRGSDDDSARSGDSGRISGGSSGNLAAVGKGVGPGDSGIRPAPVRRRFPTASPLPAEQSSDTSDTVSDLDRGTIKGPSRPAAPTRPEEVVPEKRPLPVAKSLQENPFQGMEFATGDTISPRTRSGDADRNRAEKTRGDSGQARSRQKGKDKAKDKGRDRGSLTDRIFGSFKAKAKDKANAKDKSNAKERDKPKDKGAVKEPSTGDSSSGIRRRPKVQSPPYLFPALVGGMVLSLIMAVTGIWLISKRLNAPVQPPAPAPAINRPPIKGPDELPPFETKFKLEKKVEPPATDSGS